MPRLPTPSDPAALTPDRVFVVQLRVPQDADAEHLCGRVEHVPSGRRERFASVEELLRFMHDALDTSHPTRTGETS